MALLMKTAGTFGGRCFCRVKQRGYFALEPANATAPENGGVSAAHVGGSDG